MTIAEPMTMLPDYALAGVSGWLGWRLFRARAMQIARLWWAIALIALALTAVLGGTHHGFAPVLGSGALNLLWKATLAAIGVAFFGMVTGSPRAMTAGTPRTALLALATSQLVLYLALVLGHDDYILAVADTAAAMVDARTSKHGPRIGRTAEDLREPRGSFDAGASLMSFSASGCLADSPGSYR